MKFMENLRNISVKKRMTISFGIVTGLSSIAAIVAVVMLFVVNIRYSKALELNGFIQGDIGHYATYLNEERILIRDIISLVDQNAIDAKKAELATADEKIAYYFQAIYDKLETSEERAIVQSSIANLEKYHALRKEVISLDENGKAVDAFLLLQGEAGTIAHELVKEAEQLLAMNVEMGDKISDNLSAFSMIIVLAFGISIPDSSIVVQTKISDS